MSQKELTDALETVHRELSDSDHLDPGEVEKLRTTNSEIQAILDQQAERGESLSERVAGSARRLVHPMLTSFPENRGAVSIPGAF